MPWRPWDDDWYPPSHPIPARGGIRAQSKRGRFGGSWWAERWIGVLESFDIGARLQRGRAYARQGQVLSIDVAKGTVDARVQGSRREPYRVTIRLRQLTAPEWRRVAGSIAGQPIFAAKLLGGEMPRDIDQAFTRAGLSLFPARSRELVTACSCPDASNPCKHIAAVYYLLGEEFDRDPFLLFRLRGLEREELIDLLEQRTRQSPGRGGDRSLPAAANPDAPSQSSEPLAQPRHPLTTDSGRFWNAAPLPDGFHGAVQTPGTHAALVRRLGRFPFWRGEAPIADLLEPTYAAASQRGLETFLTRSTDSIDLEGPQSHAD